MDCDEIVERLIDGGHKITSNIRDAIYILSDGRYVDGWYSAGVRSDDHRCMESVLSLNRYDNNFWDEVFDLNVVMIQPEEKVYTYPSWMKPTDKQITGIRMLEDDGYTYMPFD